jgi:hypothetical protein
VQTERVDEEAHLDTYTRGEHMADMIFVRAAVVTLVLIVIEVALVSGLTVLVVEMLSAGRLGACAIPIRARPCSLHI